MPLNKFNNSKLGQTLDVVDLVADLSSMVPGPHVPYVGALGIITGIPQAAVAAQDYVVHNVPSKNWKPTLDQTIAFSKLIPGGSVVKHAGKKVAGLLGKSDKYMRKAHPYFRGKVANGVRGVSQIDLVAEDLRRLPIFMGSALPDAINIGADIYELKPRE